jgi:U3 small nucleolar RNA-associated protein 14
MQAQSTWHETILKHLEDGNGVYTLVDELVRWGDMARVKIWAVKSDTDEMGFYYVIDLSTGRRVCTCDGFRYAGHCKHTGRVPEK